MTDWIYPVTELYVSVVGAWFSGAVSFVRVTSLTRLGSWKPIVRFSIAPIRDTFSLSCPFAWWGVIRLLARPWPRSCYNQPCRLQSASRRSLGEEVARCSLFSMSLPSVLRKFPIIDCCRSVGVTCIALSPVVVHAANIIGKAATASNFFELNFIL